MDQPTTTTIDGLSDRYGVAVAETTLQVLDEGRTSAKVEELAMIAARYADGELGAWQARPTAPAVACRRGCASCCHVAVGVAIPEAILIGHALLSESTEAELAEVLDRVRRAEAARRGLAGRERDRVRHPCPMLDEADGSCSIYEFRPLNCRGWNSLDAARCEAYFADPSGRSTVPIDGVRRTISEAIAAGMRAGLAARGLEHAPVDLTVALRIILEDPAAVDRWLAGDPSFAEAEVA